MATYDELLTAAEDAGLNRKIRVACIVAAEAIRTESTAVANHANRMTWAKLVFQNPITEAQRMIWAVLAQNKAATLSAIVTASDATVQTAVTAAVDVFATGGA